MSYTLLGRRDPALEEVEDLASREEELETREDQERAHRKPHRSQRRAVLFGRHRIVGEDRARLFVAGLGLRAQRRELGDRADAFAHRQGTHPAAVAELPGGPGQTHRLETVHHVARREPAGRQRGVLFDVGHGGGSFSWGVAVPAIQEGFLPDTISTDLHVASMNTGMKDLANVMSKFLALGLSLEDVVARTTWNAARAIQHQELGQLSVGAPADVTVLSRQAGRFGFVDSFGGRLRADEKLVCEMTLRDGRVVYDLNGLARPDWQTLPRGYRSTGDARWDGYIKR